MRRGRARLACNAPPPLARVRPPFLRFSAFLHVKGLVGPPGVKLLCDEASQFTSSDWQALFMERRMVLNMSRPGKCHYECCRCLQLRRWTSYTAIVSAAHIARAGPKYTDSQSVGLTALIKPEITAPLCSVLEGVIKTTLLSAPRRFMKRPRS